jgi:hypothetical protein
VITCCILLTAAIALLLKIVQAFGKAKHLHDSEELRKHVIRMEGRR